MKMLWGAKQVVELGWVVEVGREKLPGSPVGDRKRHPLPAVP
jgi:hypothetical protein